ncbi:MAG TPA: hypothetical protein VGM60_12925 [Pseudonocardia sp.]
MGAASGQRPTSGVPATGLPARPAPTGQRTTGRRSAGGFPGVAGSATPLGTSFSVPPAAFGRVAGPAAVADPAARGHTGSPPAAPGTAVADRHGPHRHSIGPGLELGHPSTPDPGATEVFVAGSHYPRAGRAVFGRGGQPPRTSPASAGLRDARVGARPNPASIYAAAQTPAEPPAGLGLGGRSHYPIPIPASPLLPRQWWIFAAAGAVVLLLAGVGSWMLLGRGGGSASTAAADMRLVSGFGLSYQVPKTWTPVQNGSATQPWAFGITPQGVAAGPSIDCGGQPHARSAIGVMAAYPKKGQPADVNAAAAQFAVELAANFYGADATVQPSTSTPLQVGGLDGATSMVTVLHTGSSAGCALAGQVNVVALPSDSPGPNGTATVRVLAIAHDTDGGPRTPGHLKEEYVQKILSSVQVNQR